MTRFVVRRWVGLSFLLYLGLAVAFTLKAWPDPTHTWAGVPGDPDKFMNFLSWYPHALTAGHNPFFDGYLNVPRGTNMMWDTTMPLPAFVAWPVNAIWGPVATYNAVLVMGLALDGWCGLLWLRRHITNPFAALVPALIMEFGPYTGARALGHLNLVLIFAFPLLLIALEELFFRQRWTTRRAGIFAGTAAAIQLLCSEEILAIFALMAVVVLIIAALYEPRAINHDRAMYIIRAGGYAVVPFIVLAGYPMYYQFFGAARVHGIIQPAQLYADNLWSLVIPNSQGWLQLPVYGHYQGEAPIGIASVEANAYIGLPMIIILGFMAVRWRHDRWVVGGAACAIAAFVLALGPRLQIGGHTYQHIVLPGWVLAHVPVFGNILPGRFGIALDAAMALVFGLFLQRHVLVRRSWYKSACAAVIASAAAVTLASVPPPVTREDTPAYFQADGHVKNLIAGSSALVIPFFDGSSMLWQTRSDFHIKLDEGLAIHARDDGKGEFFGGGPVAAAYAAIENTGVGPTRTDTLRLQILRQLQTANTMTVIVGPMSNQQAAVSFTNWLLGTTPTLDEGVMVWKVQ